MKKYKVTFFMVDIESGGFSSGIAKSGIYTNEQISNNEHRNLITEIDLFPGCEWSISYIEIIK